MRTNLILTRFTVLLAVLLLLAVGCGEDDVIDAGQDPQDAEADTIAAEHDLSGAQVTVGSKEFTEQLVLGQITILALEEAGAEVNDQTGLVGSTTVRQALTSGEIDMYWEYTGTGWITHLGNTEAIQDSREQYEAVADADAANGIRWLQPAPFDNTYAIAVGPDFAAQHDITRLSELGPFLGENPELASLCAAAEFLTRDDGLPGLEQEYGFEIPDADIVEMELGLVYPTVASGEDCTFGEVFATDGRIAGLDLTVLEDDQKFFPSYRPSLNVREEVAEEHGAVVDLFVQIAAALDTETIRDLNSRVDVDGDQPEEVARDFLGDHGFIAG